MLQLGKCAKDNSKRKVSKLSFGWNVLGHPYKSQNFKSKYNKKHVTQKLQKYV